MPFKSSLTINGMDLVVKHIITDQGTVTVVHVEGDIREQEVSFRSGMLSDKEEYSESVKLCKKLVRRIAPIDTIKEAAPTLEEEYKNLIKNKTINILGAEYSIIFTTPKQDKRLAKSDGYHCGYDKTIGVNISNCDDEDDSIAVSKAFDEKVLRHEIIHAYLFESGLDCQSDWAVNEEMVDWLALQMPKLIGSLSRYC